MKRSDIIKPHILVIIVVIPLILLVLTISSMDHAHGQSDNPNAHGILTAHDHVSNNPASEQAKSNQYDRVQSLLVDEIQGVGGGSFKNTQYLSSSALPLPDNYEVITKHHILNGDTSGTIGRFHVDYPSGTEIKILGVKHSLSNNPNVEVFFPNFPVDVHNDESHTHSDGTTNNHGWLYYSIHTADYEEDSINFDMYFEIDSKQYKNEQVIKFHDVRNHNLLESLMYALDTLFYDEQGELVFE